MTTIAQEMCPVCKVRPALSPHHIKPRAEGGSDDDRNIVYLCTTCHDIVEEIYDRTGRKYSPDLADWIRLQVSLGKSPYRKSSWRERNKAYLKAYRRLHYLTHKEMYQRKPRIYPEPETEPELKVIINLRKLIGSATS